MNKFFFIKEHVFCTTETYALSAEFKRAFRVFRLIRVCSYSKSFYFAPYSLIAHFITPAKENIHIFGNCCGDKR